MLMRTMLLAAVAGFLASAGFASDCTTNFRQSAQGTETSVEISDRTPESVIVRLGGRLQAAGVAMKTSEPTRGTLEATGLTVTAQASGLRTRVTFRSAVSADQATLCRYVAMLDDPALTNNDVVRFRERSFSDEEAMRRITAATAVNFDLSENGLTTLRARKVSPKVIAAMMQRAGAAKLSAANADSRSASQIRADLIARGQIGHDNNLANFESEAAFLDFSILDSRPIASDMREYVVTVLLPRDATQVRREDMDDAATGFAGERTAPHTRPVRVEAVLQYRSVQGVAKLVSAEIRKMESLP